MLITVFRAIRVGCRRWHFPFIRGEIISGGLKYLWHSDASTVFREQFWACVEGLVRDFVFHRNSSSAEIKNEWSCTCTHLAPPPPPPPPPPICLYGVDRDIFALTFTFYCYLFIACRGPLQQMRFCAPKFRRTQ